ncbi:MULTISPECIES: bifunctional RNase H/acid phosphatase [Catenuloplanes]|uniref:Phosphoglycerate mutase n=1 Tax=Catenuloplanes niger TaxID=587534 RepID=A0AAE4CR92_9ACTN|nr:bifunctional RNase H/acid phosphatase [Catenuloplanes niger]MDR7321775.1 putative phosphoglycerate mutase [Catenuloplanes niger]
MSLHVIVEADGGSRGNPGPAGYGAVVIEAATGQVLAERFDSVGVATNNVAEYSGLIAGLEAAGELGATEVDVRMDSKLVVEQMSGRWQIKNPGLRPLAATAAQLIDTFDSVSFTWIPRERNKAADALANKAMDGGRSVSPQPVADVAAPDSSARALAKEIAANAAGPARVAVSQPKSWVPPSLTAATRMILIRHGETEMTAEKRYSGRGDVPLSALGLEQAAAAARRVAALAPDLAAVVTSPLTRCAATAAEIARAAGGVPVLTEAGLIECDFGDWEGRTFAEVRERWPAEMQRWLDSTAVAPPGGESFRAVAKRIRGARAAVLAAHEGTTIAVVSHVTPIKLLLQDALAASDAFLHRLYLEPAGISIVDTWPDGNVAVRTVNDTAHLG